MAANVNNYISAGNAAVRKAVQARKALADNKARLDEIGMQAVTEAAKTAGNTAKNNALTAQATMDAKRFTKQTELDLEADKAERNAKKTVRKAGMLGAGVGMLAVGYAKSKQKQEPNEMLGKLQDQISVFNQRAEEARSKFNTADSEKYPGYKGNDGSQPDDTVKPNDETAPVPQGSTENTGGDQWSRWSRVISVGEGTEGDDGYTTMFGHRKFTDMSRHPNSPMATPWGTQSEAAGKYQFMKPTWDMAQSALKLPDFSRDSQEKAGRWLAERRGLNLSERITDFNTFKNELTKIAPEWASMPSVHKGGKSHYGQGAISFEEAWNIYNQ